MQSTTGVQPAASLISGRTLGFLAISGLAALIVWEVFATYPTAWVSGSPLEPPELIKGLVANWTGWTLPDRLATVIHYATGILFYPIAYFLLTRKIKSFGRTWDGWIWGIITYFIALAFFAPLAGFPFLLHDYPSLSLMSLVGHAIYGFVAALVFETLNARTA